MCIHVYAASTGAVISFTLSLLPLCLPSLHRSLPCLASVRPRFPCVSASIAFPVALHILLVPCASFPPISLLIYLGNTSLFTVHAPVSHRLSPRPSPLARRISAFFLRRRPLFVRPVHASLPPLCVHESLPSFRASVPSPASSSAHPESSSLLPVSLLPSSV